MSSCIECGMHFTPREFPGVRTQNLRACKYCLEMQNWPLDEGQEPVGYKVDPDLAGIMGTMGQSIGDDYER